MKKTMFAILFVCGAAAGSIAAEFELSWYSMDAGGVMRSTGGAFELSGTIGQPDAGKMSGGDLQLNGGFWFELPPGDCDEDGVVNLVDHESFTQCLGGPDGGVLSGCECFDADSSGEVDLRDFAAITNRSGLR